jgi:glycosyltransferase involved in cell wall biosynthesis
MSTLPDLLQPTDIVLLQLSIGSPVNEHFRTLKCRKVIRYQNVTPAAYFRALNDSIARQLELGREQMKRLAGVADVNLAASRYNAGELEEAGYEDVQVLPLMLELRRLDAAPSREVMDKYSDGKLNILFVGRCAPNKRLEDLIHAHYFVQKFVHPRARLIHVGSFAGTEQYLALLQTMKRDLDLCVDFVGSVPEADLNAYYQVADVFLCMSEHEGFGIPLLEAMQAGLPVMAFDSSAVAETMDGAGVLFKEKHFDELAEWVVRLGQPGELRDGVLKGQQSRLERYAQQELDSVLRAQLSTLLV